jgi:probable rRNA maturation factor
MAQISFFAEGITYKFPHPRKSASWIKETIKKEKRKLESLNFIFCSDDYLRKINIQYLNHKTYTDIITFDQSEESKIIQGDIFISIDRVKENALKFEVEFDEEIHRVIIHGVLHLIGYGDKDPSAKTLMRKKEDAYLSLRE